MTSLRSGPLPRMAGRLTFMRAPEAHVADIAAESIAVLGVPIENNAGRRAGCRFGPLAMRETSVYFGWHANPQLAQPMDATTRKPFGAGMIHHRLVDLGDIAVDTAASDRMHATLSSAVQRVVERGAMPLLLGGDAGITAPAFGGVAQAAPSAGESRVGRLGFIQIGGELPSQESMKPRPGTFSGNPLDDLLAHGWLDPSRAVCICPHPLASREFVQRFRRAGGMVYTVRDIKRDGIDAVIHAALEQAGRGGSAIYTHFDLSAISAHLHGMSNPPQFDAMDGATAARALVRLGEGPIAALDVTGLNPTLNELSVVKTGQRLLVSCLLGFIHARASHTLHACPTT